MPAGVIPVVILNWNGEADTLECLRSLREARRPGYAPVVVDNGSAPASVARLRQAASELFPRVVSLRPADLEAPDAAQRRRLAEHLADDALIFVAVGDNVGFARGNNLGVRVGELAGASWALLLNNDTTVDPDALPRLRGFVEAHPTVVAVTPQIRNMAPASTVQNCGGDLTFFGSRRYRYAGADAGDVPAGSAPISFLTGCALLFKFTETGKLSEDFYFGEEDYEFSMRMRRRGLDMACVHDAVVYHKGGATIKANSRMAGSITLQYLNRLVDTRRYYAWWRWQATRLLAYLHLPVTFMRNRINPFKALGIIARIESHLRTHADVDRASFESFITLE